MWFGCGMGSVFATVLMKCVTDSFTLISDYLNWGLKL